MKVVPPLFLELLIFLSLQKHINLIEPAPTLLMHMTHTLWLVVDDLHWVKCRRRMLGAAWELQLLQ